MVSVPSWLMLCTNFNDIHYWILRSTIIFIWTGHLRMSHRLTENNVPNWLVNAASYAVTFLSVAVDFRASVIADIMASAPPAKPVIFGFRILKKYPEVSVPIKWPSMPHDDVMTRKRLPQCWPFVRNHRLAVLAPHKGGVVQNFGAFFF